MEIDLASADAAPKEIVVNVAADTVDLSPDAKVLTDVAFKGSLWRDARGPHVSGHFSTKVELDCARCLAPVELEIEGDFDDIFIDEERAVEKEAEITGEALDESIAGDTVELEALLREQILLELPERALCREDCRGLCPKCGQDRNLIDCSCVADQDPRWAALKDLN